MCSLSFEWLRNAAITKDGLSLIRIYKNKLVFQSQSNSTVPGAPILVNLIQVHSDPE